MISPVPHLAAVQPYAPGRSVESVQAELGIADVVKLASNENPFGPSPKAVAAAALHLATANVYNDGGSQLRQRIAAHHSVETSHVIVGNGSDSLIHQIMRTFLQPGHRAVSSEGGFVSFQIAVAAVGGNAILTPMSNGYRFDVEALAQAASAGCSVVYIPNPNNPTGTYIGTKELTWLLDVIPQNVLVVVDEAYFEYATFLRNGDYPSSVALNRPNVLTLRTFSKAYGLASLRIGYAIGSPDVIQWLERTKLPFDPNGIGCAAAVAALDDAEHVSATVKANAKSLAFLTNNVLDIGLPVSDSVANFIMVDLGTTQAATAFHSSLLHQGIITRPLAGFGLPTCVRISTGTDADNSRVGEALSRIPSAAFLQ